jgi:hypothetical protein
MRLSIHLPDKEALRSNSVECRVQGMRSLNGSGCIPGIADIAERRNAPDRRGVEIAGTPTTQPTSGRMRVQAIDTYRSSLRGLLSTERPPCCANACCKSS